MKPITVFLVLLLAGVLLTACSQEPPPETEKAQTGVETPKSPTVPSEQMVEKAEAEIQQTVSAIKQEAEKTAEMVKKEATETVEKMKTASVDTAKQTMKPEVPVVPGVATVAPAQPAAPSPSSTPPVTVSYEASMGTVTFNHAEHAGQLDCSQCHTTDPPQKIVIDKEIAHNQLCKVCHKESGGDAPTGCTGCHKK